MLEIRNDRHRKGTEASPTMKKQILTLEVKKKIRNTTKKIVRGTNKKFFHRTLYKKKIIALNKKIIQAAKNNQQHAKKRVVLWS